MSRFPREVAPRATPRKRASRNQPTSAAKTGGDSDFRTYLLYSASSAKVQSLSPFQRTYRNSAVDSNACTNVVQRYSSDSFSDDVGRNERTNSTAAVVSAFSGGRVRMYW